MGYSKGDRVRVKGRRGELVIIGPLTNPAQDGYWAWSEKAGHIVPVKSTDIKGGAA